jgi:hypothetical protein
MTATTRLLLADLIGSLFFGFFPGLEICLEDFCIFPVQLVCLLPKF